MYQDFYLFPNIRPFVGGKRWLLASFKADRHPFGAAGGHQVLAAIPACVRRFRSLRWIAKKFDLRWRKQPGICLDWLAVDVEASTAEVGTFLQMERILEAHILVEVNRRWHRRFANHLLFVVLGGKVLSQIKEEFYSNYTASCCGVCWSPFTR
jgi:hypothetical protein